MPKTIDPDLLDCLRRPNPYVEHRIEISAPDVSKILRRSDQFLGAEKISETPASTLAYGVNGGLELVGTTATLASFTGEATSFDLNLENEQRRLKGLSWRVDSAFNRATLRTFTAKISRASSSSSYDFELEVFRMSRVPGSILVGSGTGPWYNPGSPTYKDGVSYTPHSLLKTTIKKGNIAWTSNVATLSFSLIKEGLIVEAGPPEIAYAADGSIVLPAYYFVVRPLGVPSTTGLFSWKVDNVSSRTVANVGTFERVFWARDNADLPWVEDLKGDVPRCTIEVDAYPATSQAVYSIDLGRAPIAGTTGRVVLEQKARPGTSTTLEISTAGSGGPWTAIANEASPSVAQQTYHLRLTLNADAALRATPSVSALGIEYRTPYDVSLESIAELPSREIQPPWGVASIPESRLTVLRTGIRDYLDTATILGSTKPVPQLEADFFLASRHPLITRDKWLRLERMSMTNRTPGPTSEVFTLLSYSQKLKRKIPETKETINSVHTVSSSTTAQVVVTPVLPGTSTGGNEYDGKSYYMRVRSSTQTALPIGFTQTITGSTDTTKLDFGTALPAALLANDEIEVHSAIYRADAIIWTDQDPAMVWEDLLINYAGVPSNRIGVGFLPRGGYPPKVTDRAPGDATTQAKCKVTNKISESVTVSELLDQLSFLMGGATVEIDGQICFVQLYPLFGADGTITVPLASVAATFDVRDIAQNSLATPPGLEARASVVSCKYGKNYNATDPDSVQSKATVVVDGAAVNWLTRQDLEEVGSTEVPEEITRWCYNTADEGLFLATQAASQPVRAASTGLRIFSFQAIEAQPQLVPGDGVIILTNQYTDFDPATLTAISGPVAIRGVLVGEANAGRSLRVFLGGLAESIAGRAGGIAPEVPPLVPDPIIGPLPVARLWWEITGEQKVTFYANYNGAAGNLRSDYTPPAIFYWDFGDGKTEVTTVPSVVHQYPLGHFLDWYKDAAAPNQGWHVNLLRRYTASLTIVDAWGTASTVTPGSSAGPTVLDRQMNPQVAPQSNGSDANHLGGATLMKIDIPATLGVSEAGGQSVFGGADPVTINSTITDFANTTTGSVTISGGSAATPVNNRWSSSGGHGTEVPGGPPANDAWASREKLPALSAGAVGRSIRGATLDGPNNAGTYPASTERDIWFSYTPPFSGTLTLDTSSSPFPVIGATMLGVYTGASLAALVLVGFNDYGGVFGKTDLAKFSIPVTGGVAYSIQVGCGYGQQASITLVWKLV